MKNNSLSILIAVLLTGAVTFFATRHFCGCPAKPGTVAPVKEFSGFNTSVNAHAYPVDSATWDIDTLQSAGSMVDSVLNSLKLTLPPHMGRGVVGYTISAFDLLGAMGLPLDGTINPQMKFVRVYMGFDDVTGYRMFIVPVDTAAADTGSCCGRDLFFDKDQNGQLHINPKPGQGSFVLDLISPCPIICDTSSKLIHALNATQQISCGSCMTPPGSKPVAK